MLTTLSKENRFPPASNPYQQHAFMIGGKRLKPTFSGLYPVNF